MSSFVVIGGEGFLGHAIVLQLRERYPDAAIASFDIVSRHKVPHCTFTSIDLTDEASLTTALKRAGATCVFHTAAPPANTSTRAICEKVNVEGTKAVIAACQAADVKKLVYTSSASVVNDGSLNLINVDERVPYPEHPMDHYTATKALAEELILEANDTDGLLTCAIRPSGIFGPGDRQNVPAILQVLKNGQTDWRIGKNENLCDWTYIDNVVHGHLLAAEHLESTYPGSALANPLPPFPFTITRRDLPTSVHRVNDEWWEGEKEIYQIDQWKQQDLDQLNPVIGIRRNRFDQYFDDAVKLSDPSKGQPEDHAVAGQAFTITNGQPTYFYDYISAIWYHYNGFHNDKPRILAPTIGLLLASLAELWTKLSGKPTGLNRSRVQYACRHRYYNIERARRLLNYEPIVSFDEGLKKTMEWIKAEEAEGRNVVVPKH